MTTYGLGFTRPGGQTETSADTLRVAGRITGPGGLMRTYGSFKRVAPSSTPTTGAFWVFGDAVIQ